MSRSCQLRFTDSHHILIECQNEHESSPGEKVLDITFLLIDFFPVVSTPNCTNTSKLSYTSTQLFNTNPKSEWKHENVQSSKRISHFCVNYCLGGTNTEHVSLITINLARQKIKCYISEEKIARVIFTFVRLRFN